MHVIGTAGHVDHGKSALVRALTGTDPDRFAEEKARGLTIDLGFAWLDLPSVGEVAIVDVPGHERFVRNMLAGAGRISICLFVVAANEGFMPQSREHLAILDLLGVDRGVVALTKADLVDRAALQELTQEVRREITGTSLEGIPIVACSTVTDAGLDELRAALDSAVAGAAAPVDAGRPRLWVDRVFTMAGAGTVVTGTLEGGSFRRGDPVTILPSGLHARIRTVQSHNRELESSGPGNRVALNLAGVQRSQVERGDAVLADGERSVTRVVDAFVRVLPTRLAPGEHQLTRRGAHLVYVGSAETPARLRPIGEDKLGAGEEGFVHVRLDRALPLRRGDRFVIRDAGRRMTIAGGTVLDPDPDPLPKDTARRTELLQRLISAPPEGALVAFVTDAGRMKLERALARSGAGDVGTEVLRLGDLLVSGAELERMTTEIRRLLNEHHRRHPLEAGLDRESLRISLQLGPDAFEALLASDEKVVMEGPTVREVTHSVRLTPEEEASRATLLHQLDESGFTPPLADELDAPADLMRVLESSGELVRVANFYLTSAKAQEARSKVRGRIESDGPVTVAEIRDLLGTTRKYAVPLCEWLDATGATRRQGDLRVVGPRP